MQIVKITGRPYMAGQADLVLMTAAQYADRTGLSLVAGDPRKGRDAPVLVKVDVPQTFKVGEIVGVREIAKSFADIALPADVPDDHPLAVAAAAMKRDAEKAEREQGKRRAAEQKKRDEKFAAEAALAKRRKLAEEYATIEAARTKYQTLDDYIAARESGAEPDPAAAAAAG